MVAKCIVHMHITAELKAYWLSCLLAISLQQMYLNIITIYQDKVFLKKLKY